MYTHANISTYLYMFIKVGDLGSCLSCCFACMEIQRGLISCLAFWIYLIYCAFLVVDEHPFDYFMCSVSDPHVFVDEEELFTYIKIKK